MCMHVSKGDSMHCARPGLRDARRWRWRTYSWRARKESRRPALSTNDTVHDSCAIVQTGLMLLASQAASTSAEPCVLHGMDAQHGHSPCCSLAVVCQLQSFPGPAMSIASPILFASAGLRLCVMPIRLSASCISTTHTHTLWEAPQGVRAGRA
eukprot:TRINITY_DN29684_c0_g1_i1.p1 TRINITY_DN29684_c0_g1~~TRINITY_DN29684_c0_g1_i1.p1  ORF type:complete len:163 (-),score=10.32 TRINITY_DN29684_c0_g1_i1:398-856(-)